MDVFQVTVRFLYSSRTYKQSRVTNLKSEETIFFLLKVYTFRYPYKDSEIIHQICSVTGRGSRSHIDGNVL